MNAYELADRLENELNLSENLFVFDAAKMLRQQADRIAKLEKKLQESATQYAGNGTVGIQNETKPTGFFFQIRPQTKPLSDEEIKELIVNKVTDYELCRAIEERHGIK